VCLSVKLDSLSYIYIPISILTKTIILPRVFPKTLDVLWWHQPLNFGINICKLLITAIWRQTSKIISNVIDIFFKSKQRSQNVLCLTVKGIPTFLFDQQCEMFEIGARRNSCCKKEKTSRTYQRLQNLQRKFNRYIINENRKHIRYTCIKLCIKRVWRYQRGNQNQ
jgi:hypothetical protein